jgi:tRNA dimethylallyltransferase
MAMYVSSLYVLKENNFQSGAKDPVTTDKLVHIILGPTASGKSSFALDFSNEQNGIIINADAMQCYDALPVLTAQPSAEDLSAAPHRLYSYIDASAHLTAQDWREDAIKECEKCWSEGKTPLLVGGTGFYVKALTDGFSPIPDIDLSFRTQAQDRRSEIGAEAFHDEVRSFDPAIAEILAIHDTQRTIRAWEVFHATQKPLSEWQQLPLSGQPDGWQFKYHVVMMKDKEAHINIINKRFDIMMDNGVLEEVKTLSDRIDNHEITQDALIVKAHGFRPLRRYLQGKMTLEEAAEKTKIETRQYAKRQRTWIRNQLDDKNAAQHFV